MQPGDAVDHFEIGVDFNDGVIVEGHQVFAVGGLAQVGAAAFIRADRAGDGLHFNGHCDRWDRFVG